MHIREITKQISGVFKKPVKRYYLGKTRYGTPYFYPWNFNSTILTIRKERPKFLRCKYFKVFGREISYGWPISIKSTELGWKDKYDSPRFEWSPSYMIFFFRWQFCIFWDAPDGDNDKYYEMVLRYLKYSDKDIKKAEEDWGWVDGTTKKSTWNRDYLVGETKS